MSEPGVHIPAVSPIADVLALWGMDGWLTPPLLPVVAAVSPVVGRVSTISMVSAAAGQGLGAVYDVLSGPLTGRFVVIGGATAVAGAVFGEIMATAALASGASGVLVDGSVRDTTAMAAIGMPVYAASQCVIGPNSAAHAVATGESVTIADVVVADGDFVIADSSGCVRIPAASFDDVISASRRYEDAEDAVLHALQGGEPMTSAYRYKKLVVDELRRR